MWNMTTACTLRWVVASVGSFSTWRDSPYIGKYSSAEQTPVDDAHSRSQL